MKNVVMVCGRLGNSSLVISCWLFVGLICQQWSLATFLCVAVVEALVGEAKLLHASAHLRKLL
jgi:hypothetical protein